MHTCVWPTDNAALTLEFRVETFRKENLFCFGRPKTCSTVFITHLFSFPFNFFEPLIFLEEYNLPVYCTEEGTRAGTVWNQLLAH